MENTVEDTDKSCGNEINGQQLCSEQDCPYCQHKVELIWVHGHYQCPNCKHVVVSCCGDS